MIEVFDANHAKQVILLGGNHFGSGRKGSFQTPGLLLVATPVPPGADRRCRLQRQGEEDGADRDHDGCLAWTNQPDESRDSEQHGPRLGDEPPQTTDHDHEGHAELTEESEDVLHDELLLNSLRNISSIHA